jgi:hypothetical protein
MFWEDVMNGDLVSIFGGLLLATVLVLIGFLFWDIFVEWPAYKEAHHCEATGQTRKDGMVCNHIGKTMICHPTWHYEYLCDNDERIWR